MDATIARIDAVIKQLDHLNALLMSSTGLNLPDHVYSDLASREADLQDELLHLYDEQRAIDPNIEHFPDAQA